MGPTSNELILVHGEAWQANSRFIRLGRPATPSHCFAPLHSQTFPSITSANMEAKTSPALGEKHYQDGSPDPADRESLAQGENTLHKSLKGRHMQMIAMYV